MSRIAPPASTASTVLAPPPNAAKFGAKPNLTSFRSLIAGGSESSKLKRPESGPAKSDDRAVPERASEAVELRVGEHDPRRDGESGDQDARERATSPAVEAWSEAAVDPMFRALAHAVPSIPKSTEPLAPNATLLPELELLLTRLVKRAAWGGDGKRGTARLELGAGPLDGATLLVHAEAGELSIDLELPPGAATEAWRDRLLERLSARGLVVRELSVH